MKDGANGAVEHAVRAADERVLVHRLAAPRAAAAARRRGRCNMTGIIG